MATNLQEKNYTGFVELFSVSSKCLYNHMVISDQVYAAKKHEQSNHSPCFSEAAMI